MVLPVATQVVALHCVVASRVFPSSNSFIEAFLLETGSLKFDLVATLLCLGRTRGHLWESCMAFLWVNMLANMSEDLLQVLYCERHSEHGINIYPE